MSEELQFQILNAQSAQTVEIQVDLENYQNYVQVQQEILAQNLVRKTDINEYIKDSKQNEKNNEKELNQNTQAEDKDSRHQQLIYGMQNAQNGREFQVLISFQSLEQQQQSLVLQNEQSNKEESQKNQELPSEDETRSLIVNKKNQKDIQKTNKSYYPTLAYNCFQKSAQEFYKNQLNIQNGQNQSQKEQQKQKEKEKENDQKKNEDKQRQSYQVLEIYNFRKKFEEQQMTESIEPQLSGVSQEIPKIQQKHQSLNIKKQQLCQLIDSSIFSSIDVVNSFESKDNSITSQEKQEQENSSPSSNRKDQKTLMIGNNYNQDFKQVLTLEQEKYKVKKLVIISTLFSLLIGILIFKFF